MTEAQRGSRNNETIIGPSYMPDPPYNADQPLLNHENNIQYSNFEGGHCEEQRSDTLYSLIPNAYSTINWLGFNDENSFQQPFGQDWQYPDQHFYMPASDSHSISQQSQSPATFREAEAAAERIVIQDDLNIASPCGAATVPSLATDESNTIPGEFYADGGVGRLTRMRKRRAYPSQYTISDSQSRSFSLAFPQGVSPGPSDHEWVSEQAYKEMELYHSSMCASTQSFFEPFESTEFPLRRLLDHLCSLFTIHCSSSLPLLHVPTLRTRSQHWLLTLGMAALGSHYLRHENINTFVLSMHELIRRLLLQVEESPHQFSIDFVTRYQVTLLHAVGSVYCGDPLKNSQGLARQTTLATFFLRSLTDSRGSKQVAVADLQERWLSWAEEESRLRLRCCTWLLDCIWSIQFQTRAELSLQDATFRLPADDKVWNAGTAADWANLIKDTENLPDLTTALDTLYATKAVHCKPGEFSRILLIYGLHHRLYEVANYYGQKLSHMTLDAQRTLETPKLPDMPIWLPAVSVFRQWQNMTCDSLDVLHWAANATIGEASGFEHPTVLHLHLARVELLSPIREIVNLANHLAGHKGWRAGAESANDRQAVHRWAFQHQYKARLAVIHAGAVFWHVRRFSANAFHEPTAVAHAALVLWAFSAFSSRAPISQDGISSDTLVRQPESDANHDSSDSDGSSDKIIFLDRPADDEIVQEFVLNGPRMRANMTGVGDLYGKKGPERVLREGSKILKTLGCWRIWESWAKILDKLVVVCKRERKRSEGLLTSGATHTGDITTSEATAEQSNH